MLKITHDPYEHPLEHYVKSFWNARCNTFEDAP